MKLKKFAIIILAFVMILAVSGCSAQPKFMSDGEKNNLVSKYGTPQAKMTLEYTVDSKTVTAEITYNLLLDKAPITVVNFIRLVESGYYDAKTEGETVTSVLFDNRISSSTNAWVAGRYVMVKGATETTYEAITPLDYTIVGEFFQNGYELPKAADETDEDITDGNAKFSLLSLAMFHNANVDTFNSASGAFFMTTSSTVTENYKNYAVFAEVASVTLKSGDEVIVENAKEVPAELVYDINNRLTSTSSRTVIVDKETEDKETRQILTNVFRIVKVEMVGTADYSSLPVYEIR